MTTKRDKVLILGAGHAGCGMAADFEDYKKGSTILWAADGHDRVFRKIKRQGCLRSYLELNGTYNPELTKDLEYGFSRAWLAIVATPATGQHDIIAIIAKLMEGKKINGSKTLLMFNSGRLVAPLAAQQLKDAGFKNILETGKSPYSSRVEELDDGTVRVRLNAYKRRLHVAGLNPISLYDRTQLNRIFRMKVIYMPNILKLFLLGQYFIHISAVLSNLSPIETKEPKKFYSGLMSPGVCTLSEHAHQLTLDVATKLGFTGMETMLEAFKNDYDSDAPDLASFVRDCPELNRRCGLPDSTRHRQLDEDVLYYAAPVVSIAEAVGVTGTHLDIVRGWIASASVLNGKDYRAGGRKLEDFGLSADATKEQILDLFNARRD
ncbi:6-phosphogluconate dehydrogenase C-terminal domain-like protein [Coniochaeta ligniaria NRRL 30616]|uniref:6-phosphogluconate dehydrogenase C-terminal domain-like protein n=1 Tax=Coniochaeta ligniaria NRRL 30616 TaxID=1408157 RepID=A0A1J7IF75_9PEZI|nr:6-phosphogluconate dehydrogenase C-terminal domain-like protein [Coniochaeta ligniaria NRRL 30616]